MDEQVTIEEAEAAAKRLLDARFDEDKIRRFEQRIWDKYGLAGELDHIHLFEECQARAQRGDMDAAKVLRVLDSVHRARKEVGMGDIQPGR